MSSSEKNEIKKALSGTKLIPRLKIFIISGLQDGSNSSLSADYQRKTKQSRTN